MDGTAEKTLIDWDHTEAKMFADTGMTKTYPRAVTLADGIFKIGGTAIGSAAVGAAIGSAIGPGGTLIGATIGAVSGVALSTYDIVRRNAK